MSFTRIRISEVRFSPRPFAFSSPQRDIFLLESIAQWGIIEAPVVLEAEGVFWPVCGEGRLLAARKLGVDEVEVKVLKGISPLSVLWLALESNLFRKLNWAEKAEVVNRLKQYLSPEEIARKVFPRLDLPENPRWYFFLERLAESPEEVKLAIAGEKLNPKAAERLVKLSPEKQLFFVRLFSCLALTYSEQREVLEGLLDLSKRWDRKIEKLAGELLELPEADVLRLRGARSPGNEERKPCFPPETKKHFLRKLRSWLRPHLSRWEEKLKDLKTISSQGILVEPSPAFEKASFQIRFTVRNARDLQDKREALATLSSVLFPSKDRESE